MIHLSKSSRISPQTTATTFVIRVVFPRRVAPSGAAYPIVVFSAVNRVLRRFSGLAQPQSTALVIASEVLLSDRRDTQHQSPPRLAIVIRHSPPKVRPSFG